MSAITPTLFDKLLKEFYTPKKLQSMLFKDFAVLEVVAKKNNCSGKYFVQPVLNGANVRRSASFATAYSVTASTPGQAFQVPWMNDYALATIDGKLFRESNSDVGSFVSAFKQQMDASMATLRKSYALKAYRTGTGSVCQLSTSANTASSILALANAADCYNFEVGEYPAFSASTTDGAALRGGSGTIPITDIDPLAGTITLSVSLNSVVTQAIAGDYIYLSTGDAQNNGSTLTCVGGLQAWAPATTSSLTVSFYGVTRSSDRRRLAGGWQQNTGALPIDEQIQGAVQQLITNGGKPDVCLANPVDVLALTRIAANKILRDQGGEAKIGFQSVVFVTPNGNIKVMPDPACPVGRAFVIESGGIVLASLGEMISVLKEGDSTAVEKIQGLDQYMVRFGGYPALVVERPGQNLCQVSL